MNDTKKRVIITFLFLMILHLLIINIWIILLISGFIDLGSLKSTTEAQDVYTTWIYRILFICILGPVTEEFIYRKLIYRFLLKRNIKYSNAIQAFIFAVAHLDISKLFATFVTGLLLGNTYLKEGNLKYPIVLHMGINLANIFMSHLIVYLGLYFGVVSIYITLCLTCISLYFIFKKIDKNLFNL